MDAYIPVIVSYLLSNTAALPENSGTYIEQDGLVVIEAENTQSNLDQWVSRTQIPGFTGDSYLGNL